MDRMTRLTKNLQVLRHYCAARAALYGCWVRDVLTDLQYVTDDGGRTLIPAEDWAELHGGHEYDELLQHMAGQPTAVIHMSHTLEGEVEPSGGAPSDE